MKLSEIKPLLFPVFLDIITKVSNIRIYLYGSILNKLSSAMDIDILIIYNRIDDIKIIGDQLLAISFQLPLHIIYMTHEEEKELNFIETQSAINISELDSIL